MERRTIKVCLVEHDVRYRSDIESALRRDAAFECVGSLDDAETALPVILQATPDVIVLDFILPGMKGDEFIFRVREQRPEVRIIVLTGVPDDHVVFDALAAGTQGFLYKEEIGSMQQLLDEIRLVHGGKVTITERAWKLLSEKQRMSQPDLTLWSRLTPRQREIVALWKEGHGAEQIADALGISIHTVHDHAKHIYETCHTHSRWDTISRLWVVKR